MKWAFFLPFHRLQKFINRLAVAERRANVVWLCEDENENFPPSETEIGQCEFSVPSLQYSNTGGSVLQYWHVSTVPSVNFFRTNVLVKFEEILCHRQPIYELL